MEHFFLQSIREHIFTMCITEATFPINYFVTEVSFNIRHKSEGLFVFALIGVFVIKHVLLLWLIK